MKGTGEAGKATSQACCQFLHHANHAPCAVRLQSSPGQQGLPLGESTLAVEQSGLEEPGRLIRELKRKHGCGQNNRGHLIGTGEGG